MRFVEEWAPVKGFEGLYEVSSIGRVKRIAPGKSTRPGRILVPVDHGNGYMRYCLSKNGKNFSRKAHRLVAESFEIDGEGPHINHKDANKANNWRGNLEWCTNAENIAHAQRNGLLMRGVAHVHAKLCEADVILIRFLRKIGKTNTHIRAKLGKRVGSSTIFAVANRQNWAHVK